MSRSFLRAVATASAVLGAFSAWASDVAETDVAAESAAVVFNLPDFVPARGNFYPDAAASRLEQGAVGIEFQIDAEGRAQNLQQTFTDDPDFSAKSEAFLKSGRFRVDEDWGETSGPGLRFFVEVQFSVARDGAACEEKPPHVADTEVLVVCRRLYSRRDRRLR